MTKQAALFKEPDLEIENNVCMIPAKAHLKLMILRNSLGDVLYEIREQDSVYPSNAFYTSLS